MDAVKLVDVDKGLIEGFAIPFGGPMPGGKDLDNEAFTKDTELFLDAYDKRPLLYHHGMDKAMGTKPIGPSGDWEEREGGIWLQAQIDMGVKFRDHLIELAKGGLLGFSTGAHPRSVVKSAAGLIERWMWIETSLTPIPSNPFSMIAMKAHGYKNEVDLPDQVQLCEKLGHFPDAGEVAEWRAEKAQKAKPDAREVASLVARIQALEAEKTQREQVENDKIRREIKRLKEALDVTS